MEKQNVLLVFPKITAFGNYYTFPLGMAYVSAYLKSLNYNVFTLNLNEIKGDWTIYLKKIIIGNNISIAASGGASLFWNELEILFKTIKQIDKTITTIIGGPILTATPELAMQHIPVDIGVIGEGELVSAAVLSALEKNANLAEINGVIFRDKKGNIVKTSEPEHILNLDDLPFPDYSGFGFENWLKLDWTLQPAIKGLYFDYGEPKKIADIIGSRSCPYNCSFCYHPLGKKYRMRSLENIFLEIDMLIEKFGVNLINFLDELLSHNDARISELSARIKRYNIKWLAQWRVDTVKKDIMNKIKESNVFVIGLGVESLDNTVLQSMNKKVNSDQILSALEIAYNNGVRTGSNIIIGDPAETFKSANESIDWTLKNSKYDFSLDFIMAIPDAPIYRNAVNNGIIKNELNHIKNNFPVINLTKMSDSEFNALRSKVAVINIMLKHKPLADVIDTKKISRSNNRNIYQFSVKCPLCSAISIYKYYIFSRKPITPVLCKTCYKVLKIKTAKAFPDDYNFFKSNFFYAGVLIYHSFLYRISFFRKIFFALKKIIDK